MAYSKDEAVQIIRSFARHIEGELPIQKVLLYGSYAVGRQKEYSDIDVAIVSPAVHEDNAVEINRKIFHEAMLYNVDVEPVCFSVEEYEDASLPVVREIRRQGVEVDLSKD